MELVLVVQIHVRLVQVRMFALSASHLIILRQLGAVIHALLTAQTVQTLTPARNAKMDYISMVNSLIIQAYNAWLVEHTVDFAIKIQDHAKNVRKDL